MNDFIFDIKKPVDGKNGTYVYLRESELKRCIKMGCKVFVKIPRGVAEIDPKMWIKNGKRMSKIFLRPDEPMILIGGVVPVMKNLPVEVDPRVSLF